MLVRNDPAADAAVEALAALSRREAWAFVELAVREGSASIRHAPAPLRALVEEAEVVPAWVDWDTCDRGGAVLLRSGPVGGLVLGARSLVLGYASPAGNKPLVLSGRLKDYAVRRLNETARFVQAVCRPGGMRPRAEGWQITLKVRLIHAQVRRMILVRGPWRADAWGAPVNQHDMAATVLLFSCVLIDGLRRLGLRVSAEEAERYAHLWRWVGRVIGVDEVILPASDADARRLSELIAATQEPPDDDSRELTRVLLESPHEALGATSRSRDRRGAEVRVAIGSILCRELLGDALADALAVPRHPMRRALPLVRRLVASVDALGRRVPNGEAHATTAGLRYWDRVIDVGARSPAPADAAGLTAFVLPDRLGAWATM